jgi:hypothetical protein
MIQTPGLVLFFLLLQVSNVASGPGIDVNGDTFVKIRDEGQFRSQIMRSMHFLTDVYGPRLTGSPNYKSAADWAARQLESWGIVNAHLEPWDFGHPGWLNERFSAYVISPFKDQLTCEVVAWTPGTRGPITGEVYVMTTPEKPGAESLAKYFEGVRDAVRGKVVFAGKPQMVPFVLTPAPKRRDDEQVRAAYDPKNPRPAFPQIARTPAGPADPAVLTANQVTERLDAFLVSAGAIAKVTDAGMPQGKIRAFGNRTYDIEKSTPAIVMRNEDYGRLSRIVADGTPVVMELNIVNRTYPEGKTAYNVVAELPGTDKKDEIVMLGAHLDSWHSATGATDNAIGCAVMMEAARILKSCGLQTRRTIRIALWSAEEQGLLGSQAYVKEHFGTFEAPKPEYDRLMAYFNIDSGTGRARGMNVFGPAAAADILREAIVPFADLGVVGAISSRSRRLGGTDSTSFNQAGLPGIGIGQDPIEYFTDTWHTSVDTYERILEDDAKSSAIVVAGAAYQLAMRDEMLPRFTKDEMPAPPKSEGDAAPAPPRPPTH